jgi:hypothetical protein
MEVQYSMYNTYGMCGMFGMRRRVCTVCTIKIHVICAVLYVCTVVQYYRSLRWLLFKAGIAEGGEGGRPPPLLMVSAHAQIRPNIVMAGQAWLILYT